MLYKDQWKYDQNVTVDKNWPVISELLILQFC